MSTVYQPKALPEDKKEEILAELAKGFGDMHGPQSFTEPALDWPNGEKSVPVTLNGVKGVALRSEVQDGIWPSCICSAEALPEDLRSRATAPCLL